MKRVDLTGQRFTKLVVVSRSANRNSSGCPLWLCQCDCGNTHEATSSSLTRPSNGTKSCGCSSREWRRKSNIRHGHACRDRLHPMYQAWLAMLSRCRNPNDQHYGGRGIRVCERWHDFALFLEDMGERPPGKSLDRIDNDGNYEPGNCRWATRSEQGANRRNSAAPIEFGGRSMPIARWAAELGINRRTLSSRIEMGWSPEKALTWPVGRKNPEAGL